MGSFFAELKRRHIYRVAAAYAVVAWVLLQLVNNIAPGLNLPNWAVTLVIVLLAVGFPIALVFAWINQLAPADVSAARATTGKLDWCLIGALVAVIALVSYQQLGPPSPRTVQQASVIPAASSPAQSGGISIAVLPFVNLSSDAEQEFFSDGMTEEITSALAKVKGLNVVARTSAFEFKGQNKDVRTIAQALSASHLIEGSVRKAGTRVRITAQLIRADTGAHLWTDSYDRELKDIFATQEDIAQAIAGALQVPLGLKQGETLVSNRLIDPETYQDYLRARALFRARSLDYGTALLETIVKRDPNFAPAWALLAGAYRLASATDPVRRSGTIEEARRLYELSIDKSDKAAREAIRLDPKVVSGYSLLAFIQLRQGKWAAAEDLYRQGLAFDPNDAETLDTYGRMFAYAGRLKDALLLREQLHALEPFVPIFNIMTADMLLTSGQREPGVKLLEAIPPEGISAYSRNVYLARAYAEQGRYGLAANTLLSTPQKTQVSRQAIEDAARLLRSAPAKVSSPESLPALDGELSFVYPYVGAPNRVLDDYERAQQLAVIGLGLNPQIWSPGYAPVRKTERFKTIVRKAGLVEYWKVKGWPDACHPTTGDDFACE